MLDSKDLARILKCSPSYAYGEIERLKKKYKLEYKRAMIPESVMMKESSLTKHELEEGK